jgi:K+-transporting ATPase ATPase C chain
MKTWQALRLFLWMTLLTGVLYPLFITVVAQLTMKQKTDGGIILSAGKPVGALLIGQKFENNKYFWGRPSATDYNTLPSGGSNLGPISTHLKDEVKARKEKNIRSMSGFTENIPGELLFASGSGLDPHIGVSTAKFQIDRVIKARGLDTANDRRQFEKLIDQMAEALMFKFLGPPHINVLQLNLAIDEQFNMSDTVKASILTPTGG